MKVKVESEKVGLKLNIQKTKIMKILKDDAVKVLHSIRQQIWKTQQSPQDWKRSVFQFQPKRGNAKKYLNCCTVVLISHDVLCI